MKKFVVATFALTLIVVIGLLVKRNSISKEAFPDAAIQAKADQALKQAEQALTGAPVIPAATEAADTPVVANTPTAPEEEEGMVLTEEQMLKLEAYFEKVEKDWSERINQLMVRELELEPKVVEEYYKMREGFEQDKLDAFEDFHEEMIEKYGENYTYRPSEEEQMFSAKVRERYDQALVKLIGQDNYVRYLEMRDQFNRELAEVDDKDLGFIKIDF